MAPKKPAITSKALQTLLTRIGSASSGTKSALLARFQRDVQRPGFFNGRGDGYGCGPDGGARSDKLRVVSIDMGIRNLAFCDVEVSRGAEAHMRVLRWEKLDLTHHHPHLPAGDEAAAAEAENEDEDEEADPFSPGVLARTAHRLVVEQVLSADPDVVLIEKQRWRSGGGSAVQQWTVRVNTLEAMLWAILEAAKQQGGGGLPTSSRQHQSPGAGAARTQGYRYSVRAVDPKRVGQYWLGRHARAVQEREGGSATAAADARALFPANANPGGEEGDQSENTTTTTTTEKKEKEKEKKKKQPTIPRSKAEKSAKIALLRSWLADATLSTSPSSPRDTPAMALSMAPAAEPTRIALLPKPKPKPKPKREPGPATKAKAKAARSEKKAEAEAPPLLLGEDMETQMQRPRARARTPKLDDLADCFLQAAAWVAWEGERGRLLGAEQEGGVDEGRVGRMVECSQSRGEA